MHWSSETRPHSTHVSGVSRAGSSVLTSSPLTPNRIYPALRTARRATGDGAGGGKAFWAKGTPTPSPPLRLANVDWLVAFGVLGGLALLLVWTRRRWGQPRLHVRGVVALWLLAGILAVIIVWLVLD